MPDSTPTDDKQTNEDLEELAGDLYLFFEEVTNKVRSSVPQWNGQLTWGEMCKLLEEKQREITRAN